MIFILNFIRSMNYCEEMNMTWCKYPPKRTIHFQRSSDKLIMPAVELAMRKIRFTKHQIIAVLKSVETGR